MVRRQIHDAISNAQEVLHTIKVNNLVSMTIKVDLSKVYNRVNLIYLRLVLLQVGFLLQVVNWIMSRVQSISFVVMVNGLASYFFRLGRGPSIRIPFGSFFVHFSGGGIE